MPDDRNSCVATCGVTSHLWQDMISQESIDTRAHRRHRFDLGHLARQPTTSKALLAQLDCLKWFQRRPATQLVLADRTGGIGRTIEVRREHAREPYRPITEVSRQPEGLVFTDAC
jgi:hypothetical protein